MHTTQNCSNNICINIGKFIKSSFINAKHKKYYLASLLFERSEVTFNWDFLFLIQM